MVLQLLGENPAGSNNVERSWRGDPVFTGPEAVDKVTYSYTNPALPTQAVATRVVSGTFNQVTTYNLGRDTGSGKPKVISIQGSCPTCGLTPSTRVTHELSWTLFDPTGETRFRDAMLSELKASGAEDVRLLAFSLGEPIP